ncbi:MAG: hypothetical protein R2879_18665 [Saprospiraceae bacterium]
MKGTRLLVILLFVAIYLFLHFFLPSEKEQEEKKLAKLEFRNVLEKQLVGKWNFNDFPAGMEDGRCYHLLSADGGYYYRGSDNGKFHGGKWKVSLKDSLLNILSGSPEKTTTYKIKKIEPTHLILREIKPDSLTRDSEWFRHKESVLLEGYKAN